MPLPVKGLYKHYKGATYEVIGQARYSETLEEMVIYREVDGKGQIWARPLTMFLEEVEFQGQKHKRFEYRGRPLTPNT